MTSAEVRHLKPIKNKRRGAQSPLSFFPALNFVKLRHENVHAHARATDEAFYGAFYRGNEGIPQGKEGIPQGKKGIPQGKRKRETLDL